MTEAKNLEVLLTTLVTHQERLLDRVDRLESCLREIADTQRRDLITVVESFGDEISAIRRAVSGELGETLADLSESIASELRDIRDAVTNVDTASRSVAEALDTSAPFSFASQVIREFQWHEDLTFAHEVVQRLHDIDLSVTSLDR